MSTPLSAPDLANSVTAFCTLLAGVVTLLLCRFVRPQPPRWQFAYLCIFLTGIPTLGWHGFGVHPGPETVVGRAWQVTDIGSNLLLAWAIQFAVAGDYCAGAIRRRLAVGSALVNLAAVGWMYREVAASAMAETLEFGAFGGFAVGELVLIADALVITGLLYRARARIADEARPLLYLVTAFFLVGLGLATARGDVVHLKVLSYHALWHVVGAFGFILFWAFNHVRLEAEARGALPGESWTATAGGRRSAA